MVSVEFASAMADFRFLLARSRACARVEVVVPPKEEN